MNKKQQKAIHANKRKKGDKFYNKPWITEGGHNTKTGFHTNEVLNSKNGKLKSGWVWNVKKQKYVRSKS